MKIINLGKNLDTMPRELSWGKIWTLTNTSHNNRDYRIRGCWAWAGA